MKYNAKLKPLTNPRIDTRPLDTQWKEKVNSYIKHSQQTPANTSIAITRELTQLDGGVIDMGGGVTYLEGLIDGASTGFYSIPSDAISGINQLESGERMRLAKINEIVLSYNLVFGNDESGFVVPPAPTGNYDIDFYFSLLQINTNYTNNLEGNAVFDELLSVPINMSYNNTTGLFTINDPYGDIRLSDYMPYRSLINDEFPDFRGTTAFNDPTKITKEQYDRFKNTSSSVILYFGYATDQYTALTTANKNHFDAYFNVSSVSGAVFLYPELSVKLTYYGLTADYVPTN